MFFNSKFKVALLLSSITFFASAVSFSASSMMPSVAGGNAGDVLRSIDGGITWEEYNTKIQMQFSSLINANNQFVGVGNAGMGVAVRSEDGGLTWSSVSLPDFYPTQIIYANNQYVLVDDGNAETSPDAITWTKRVIPVSNNYPFAFYTGVAYGNGQYVAVGSAGDIMKKSPNQIQDGSANCIATSPDGVKWTLTIPTAFPFHSILFANNQFIATGVGGVIGTSPDGIHWTQQQSGVTDELGRIVWGNNMYMIAEDSNTTNNAYVLTSVDAIHWTKHVIPLAEHQSVSLAALTYTNNLFVLTGGVFDDAKPFGGVVYTSPDGINWTVRASGVQDPNNNPEALWAVA